MRARAVSSIAALLLAVVSVTSAQDKAAVKAEKAGPLHQGQTITFNMKLNEPLPKGASISFRISPVSTDEEITLSTEAVKGSDTEFRVSGTLPDAAFPGEWHIKVIYLFLPGSGWTTHTISPNDLRFQVEGKAYEIPTRADVSIAQ